LSRVLLEKLTISQLVTEFPAFYGNPKVYYWVQNSPPTSPYAFKANVTLLLLLLLLLLLDEYYSVQDLLSSRLISKNLKIKIYKTVILPVVLYGCETWSVALEEEHILRIFENRVLRKIFGPKREED
jgi:hypothetical protein